MIFKRQTSRRVFSVVINWICLATVMTGVTAFVLAQSNRRPSEVNPSTMSVTSKFQAWGDAVMREDKVLKLVLLLGFTNGLALDWTKHRGLLKCLEDEVTLNQAVAMIDKYYEAHPETWNRHLGEQIIKALTMNGSPCELVAAK
jgi:hypothetical protein